MAIDEDGLHGSIDLEDDTTEVQILTVNTETSSMIVVEQKMHDYGEESTEVEAHDAKWNAYQDALEAKADRRKLQSIPAGSVDVHIHLGND